MLLKTQGEKMTETTFEAFDYAIIDQEKAAWFYQESDRYLAATIAAIEAMERKISMFTAFLLTLLSALSSYMILSADAFSWQHPHVAARLLTGSTLLCALSIAAFWMLRAFTPKPYGLPGNEPTCLLAEAFCQQDFRMILLAQTRQLQKRIDKNLNFNQRLSTQYRKAIYLTSCATVLSPLVFIALLGLLRH